MTTWPALDVSAADPDLVLAAVDDFSPLAGEEREASFRVFFSTPAERDAARRALSTSGFHANPIDVPDEDWARRSQQGLVPVTVGRIVVQPDVATHGQGVLPRAPVVITIRPSMGFGTGHHPTTRLCLAAMQVLDLTGTFFLDVGTGSGLLAIAAARLGAAAALGIDSDPDAVSSARESLALNPDVQHVRFEIADLRSAPLALADVVAANLTGELLLRAATSLSCAVRSGGALIVSGLLADERARVRAAFGGMTVAWEAEEADWVGLLMKKL